MFMQNNLADDLMPIQRNIKHIDAKLSDKAVVICYADRTTAEQSILHLEQMQGKLGIDRVEYVFSQENFNVIIYFKRHYALEEFNEALILKHCLVA